MEAQSARWDVFFSVLVHHTTEHIPVTKVFTPIRGAYLTGTTFEMEFKVLLIITELI